MKCRPRRVLPKCFNSPVSAPVAVPTRLSLQDMTPSRGPGLFAAETALKHKYDPPVVGFGQGILSEAWGSLASNQGLGARGVIFPLGELGTS